MFSKSKTITYQSAYRLNSSEVHHSISTQSSQNSSSQTSMATGYDSFLEDTENDISDTDLILTLSPTNDENRNEGFILCNDDDQSKGFLFCFDTNDVCAEGCVTFFKREASSTASVQGDATTLASMKEKEQNVQAQEQEAASTSSSASVGGGSATSSLAPTNEEIEQA